MSTAGVRSNDDGEEVDAEDDREARREEVGMKGTRECSAATSSSCACECLVSIPVRLNVRRKQSAYLEDVRPNLARRRSDGRTARVDALLLPANLFRHHAPKVELARLSSILQMYRLRRVSS